MEWALLRKNLPDTPYGHLDCGYVLHESAFDTHDGSLRVYPGDGALMRFFHGNH